MKNLKSFKMFKAFGFMFFVLYLVVGCSTDTFPKYIALTGLRVLALQASTPEISPGTAVTITPYISDINNAGPWTYSAEGCFDPGISYGATPSCTDSATRTVFASSQTITSSLLTASNVYSNSVDSFTVPAAQTALIHSGRSAIDTYNGVNYLVVYTISNSSGEIVKSFRRIVVTDSSKSTKNSNPTTSDLLANGSTLGTLSANSSYTLAASYSATSAETYTYKDSSGTLVSATESLLTTWFITDGSMKYYRTSQGDSNTYTTPSSYPSSRKSSVIAVTRDSRGGVYILQRVIN